MKKVLLIVFVLALFVSLGSSVSYAKNNPTNPFNVKATEMKVMGVMYIMGGHQAAIIKYYDPKSNVMCYFLTTVVQASETYYDFNYPSHLSCVLLPPKKK